MTLAAYCPCCAATLEVLDQSFTPDPLKGGNAGLSGETPSQERAQSFTVGKSGELTAVELLIHRQDVSPFVFGGLIAEIRAMTSAGRPDPAKTPLGVLTSSFLGGGEIPRTPNVEFVRFEFLEPLAVTAGQGLALTLRADGTGTYGWITGSDNPYPAGTSFERSFGSAWFPGTYDFGFRTYVTVPEPRVLWLAATAAAVLSRRRRTQPTRYRHEPF